ncbi:hypothetical protein F5Y15DRAFT_372578 [Xylariaceae sp. FL0016]|nr:hypothetical protein F5Y15DRAFT_372578 [Xylariaceae sp. FL0016]
MSDGQAEPQIQQGQQAQRANIKINKFSAFTAIQSGTNRQLKMTIQYEGNIELIPWDHMSQEHVKRMYEQRVACGWRADEIESWVEFAKRGGRIFYWAILADAVPEREKLLSRHTEAYPKEITTLRDTASEIRLVPRQPSGMEFIPIGHVALDIHSAVEDAELGLPSPGTVWVHQLYISYVLQRGGFGTATMAKVEELATEEPMNATTMALDTMSSDMNAEDVNILKRDFGIPDSPEGWYARQGYETYKTAPGYEFQRQGGKTVQVKVAYMKKTISSTDGTTMAHLNSERE